MTARPYPPAPGGPGGTTVRPDRAAPGHPGGDLPFETSGSTGAARRWWRRPEQMVREVELIGTHVLGPVDHVVNYAPPRHLFGALFGQWLPRTADIPVHQAWRQPLRPPPVPADARVLVVCLPMTWELLRRHLSSWQRAGSVVALHSAAAPPPAAHRLVRRAAPLLRAHELLGSTETGGIAHRPVAPEGEAAAPWRLLPDVTLAGDGAAPAGRAAELVVAGPRLARPDGAPRPPAHWATGDLVEFTAPGTFRLVGRSSSLVKVNGVKVHLARVGERLAALLPGAECVALPRTGDPLGGEGYVVFWARRAAGVNTADIQDALRDFPRPSRIVEVPAVPRTAAGKPDRAALLAAASP
ncbi:acyl--CoA ligase [Streptomyces sp. 130]|uniref:class I adenylate-forming enzyme family protein n=1 Tax=Streptomyces sp. 130 TaxID=2591006 RepID=UPI00117BF78F|nr:class I adenylate-forming enzyme family protein [Streptomyces sp. 130]TRV76680.1 acyl--CoA ligase [Streptomyces sp. 130]